MLSLALGIGSVDCVREVRPPPEPVATPAPTPFAPSSRNLDFVRQIASLAVWDSLAFRPNSQHFANSDNVKILVDSSDGAVYFLQSERWPVHYWFARRYLSRPEAPIRDASAFLLENYHDEDRRFVLATLVHYVDQDTWTFELFPGDELDLQATARAFAKVKSLVYFGDRLRYRPTPPAHEREVARARALMPIVTTDELFGKARYQPLELGEAYGYLRIFPSGAPISPSALRASDIVVIGSLPEDLPVVAGVISEQFQAPLGHINVLCHSRKTPNMAARDITREGRVVALRDQLVHLVVEGQSYRLEAATLAEAEKSWQAKRPQAVVIPARSDKNLGMPLLTEPLARKTELCGAKAAQLARIVAELPGDAVPKGFVLPFFAYTAFLAEHGFDQRIRALLKSRAFQDSAEERRRALDKLRADMEAAPVAKPLLRALMARIKAVLPKGALRFRSSTNAEDLPGFSGAGLYRSVRVVDPTQEAEVEQALKQVWASVWLYGAYEERQYFRLAHEQVAMAILVQVSVDEITASGVAITANPYNQGQPGFLINAQAATGSVTGAQGDEIPEQILYYRFDDTRSFERLSRSSRTGGKLLLVDPQVEALARYLEAIHVAMTGEQQTLTGRAVDVEFLVGKNGTIYIVQGRPYFLTWTGERRYTWQPGPPPLKP